MTRIWTQFDATVRSRCPVPRSSSLSLWSDRLLGAGGMWVCCSLSWPSTGPAPCPSGAQGGTGGHRDCNARSLPGALSSTPSPQHHPARCADSQHDLCQPPNDTHVCPCRCTSTPRAPVLTVLCLCCNSLLCLLLLSGTCWWQEKPVREEALSGTGRRAHHIMTVVIH